MLSKIRTAFRLSGQLWIKDLPDRSRICVLELDGAVIIVLVVTVPLGQTLDFLLCLCRSPHFPGFDSAFESHSVASDVLRELSKIIEVSAVCQAQLQSFSITLLFSVRSHSAILQIT
jgi:hypothetical protein